MIKTLLVDGNNLLKIGFHGVKDYYHKGKHIGGIWHFLNTTRRFIEEYNYDKVVVFWDGEDSSKARKDIYPRYKETRKNILIQMSIKKSLLPNKKVGLNFIWKKCLFDKLILTIMKPMT